MFLQSLGYDIKQELVNSQIAETACYVYQCLEINKELLECLVTTDILEKEGIDTKGWNASKYATALLIMCTNETPYSTDQGLSGEDLCKIYGAKGKHDKELIKYNFMRVYMAADKAHKTKLESSESWMLWLMRLKKGMEEFRSCRRCWRSLKGLPRRRERLKELRGYTDGMRKCITVLVPYYIIYTVILATV